MQKTAHLTLRLALWLALWLSAVVYTAPPARLAADHANAAQPIPLAPPAMVCRLVDTVRTCELYAATGTLSLPGGLTVPIWGYAPAPGAPGQLPGPTIIANTGETLRIVLHNNLPFTTTLSLPGQDWVSDLAGTPEGKSRDYTFAAVRPGTFLYQAGLMDDPAAAGIPDGARQTAMGLYGALIVRPAALPGQANPSPATAFDDETLLIYSEIDPAFNNAPLTSSLNQFLPRFRLLNGQPFSTLAAANRIPVRPGRKILLRQVNAGLQPYTLSVMGLRQILLGPDATGLPSSQTVSAAALGPGQTVDSLVTIPISAPVGFRYLIYDAGSSWSNYPGGVGNGETSFSFLEVDGGVASPKPGPIIQTLRAAPFESRPGQPITLSGQFKPGAEPPVAGEWFTNSLGATGSGVRFAINSTETGDFSFSIPAGQTAAWQPGSIVLYLRVQDSSGGWGPPNSTVVEMAQIGPLIESLSSFDVPVNAAQPLEVQAIADSRVMGGRDITRGELFIDVQDMGSPIQLLPDSPAPYVTIKGSIPAERLAALPEGPHTLRARAIDDQGVQGPFSSTSLLIDRTGPGALGVNLTPNPANGLLKIISPSTGIRLIAVFSDAASRLVRAEGFVDAAGPDGSGFPILARDGVYDSSIEPAYAEIPLTAIQALAQGPHLILFHAQDAAGNWGPLASLTLMMDKTGPAVFNVTVTPDPTDGASAISLTAQTADPANGSGPGSRILAAEWFVGDDPGPGNGTRIIIASPADTVNLSTQITVTGWVNQTDQISLRALDAAGNWTPTPALATFSVTGNAAATILADNFEQSNLSAWAERIGSPRLTPTAAMDGRLGLEIPLAQRPSYLVDQTPMQERQYKAGFSLNPAQAQTGGVSIDIFTGENAAGKTVFGLRYRQSSTGPEIQGWMLLKNDGLVETPWLKLRTAGQRVIVEWASGLTGSLKLTVDGKPVMLSGLDNSNLSLDRVKLGLSGSPPKGIAGRMYFDGFYSVRPELEAAQDHKIFLPILSR
jgi:hypothetical protein